MKKEVWHYLIVPNLFFYLLKNTENINYNTNRNRRIDWPVIPQVRKNHIKEV